MIVKNEGIKTCVSVMPYEKSELDNFGYVQSCSKQYFVKSVEGNEGTLVEIVLPKGESIICKADQIITAVQKCVR